MNQETKANKGRKNKSKAQVFLERIEMIDEIIANKLIERRQWRELAQSLVANIGGDRVQSSGTQSKLEDAVIRCIDMEGEIANEVENLIAEKCKAVKTIEQLYSPTEYKILHLRYIQYIDLSDIAKKLGKEYTWVTTTHGRALKNVQKILDRMDS